ncbi:periodic tryptophan protein 1 homolog isoform X2 [Hydra vulgaris]|uniref:Periodic tryptophan protein 1 homolog isoform X2 n=1 Tax=Hydra vulgaris TaxID=6087 RepID=A0ABM4D496_HYDVU
MLTCGTWVKRGIAKEVPDKVEISADELKELLQETKEQINDLGENVEDLDEMQEKIISEKEVPVYEDSDEEIKAEYGLDDYDEEGTKMTGAGMAGLMYFVSTEEDPYVDLKGMDDEDKEDYVIKKNDNLFVVGKMEEDHSCLDVYVYNEEESSQYVHHDILLESYPLCLEWLSYDPVLDGKPGNYIAVGTMEPDILIWDLDIVDVVEPAFVLSGMKKKKKKKLKASSTNDNGHTDAVLSLSWNHNIVNVLGSASADKTIKLWDMSKCECVHTLTHHTDKVQSIQWHPHESQSLLSGSFDKKAVLLDCRTPNVFKSWSLSGECEKVLWDHLSPCNFYVSTDDGIVLYCDVRNDRPIFTIHAHEEAVTGMCLSANIPGTLTTVSSDKKLKVWDTTGKKPTCVMSRDMKMGGLNFITACPDVNNLCAVGGEKDGLRILNVMDTTKGKEYFRNEAMASELTAKSNKDDTTEKKMDIDFHVDAMKTLSLKTDKNSDIIRKKKKKKKK